MSERKVCPLCKEKWNENDTYCRYCGTKKDQPAYIEPDFACIYGPMPKIRKHICKRCGYSWNTELMIDYEKYCPLCGGEAPCK